MVIDVVSICHRFALKKGWPLLKKARVIPVLLEGQAICNSHRKYRTITQSASRSSADHDVTNTCPIANVGLACGQRAKLMERVGRKPVVTDNLVSEHPHLLTLLATRIAWLDWLPVSTLPNVFPSKRLAKISTLDGEHSATNLINIGGCFGILPYQHTNYSRARPNRSPSKPRELTLLINEEDTDISPIKALGDTGANSATTLGRPCILFGRLVQTNIKPVRFKAGRHKGSLLFKTSHEDHTRFLRLVHLSLLVKRQFSLPLSEVILHRHLPPKLGLSAIARMPDANNFDV